MKRIAPDKIDKLAANEIFVFGSNFEGRHMGGAARTAYEKFGAIRGCGDGYQGQSYAIPTMHGGPEAIAPYVQRFIIFAKANPQMKFLVTRIGCGIAGFKDEEIAPLFIDAIHIDNIYLPSSFWKAIEDSMPQPFTRFMRMIAELHRRGYQLLRLCPSISPSGCSWRGILTTKNNTWIHCGAIRSSFKLDDKLTIYTNGEMPWFERNTSATAEQDADIFINTYPLVAQNTLGRDEEYERWFLAVLDECEHGYLVYATCDYGDCMAAGHLYGARKPFCFPPMGGSELRE